MPKVAGHHLDGVPMTCALQDTGVVGPPVSRERPPETSPGHSGPTLAERLSARNSMAAEHWRAGRVREALDAFREVCDVARSRLGPSHPDTLMAEGNLAICMFLDGRHAAGLTLMESNLDDRVLVLGVTHRETMAAAEAVVKARALMGDILGASTMWAAVTARRSRLLGATHPETLLSRLGAALMSRQVGRTDLAIDELEQIVLDVETAAHDTSPDDTSPDDSAEVLARAARLLTACRAERDTLGRGAPPPVPPANRPSAAQQATLPGHGDGGRAVGHVQLREAAQQVGLDRRLTDVQLAADLGVGPPDRHQAEHLYLPG